MSQHEILTCLGLMSGTSMDGIDAALIRTDGRDQVDPIGFLTRPYDRELRAQLRAAVSRQSYCPSLEQTVTIAHAHVVADLLRTQDANSTGVDLIGFHGHTLVHAPDQGRTVQLGDGRLLAQMTGIPVINDFRAADVAAGGQGAPLAPLYHRAIAASLRKPLAFLNLGGVGNVTWLGANGAVLAFDTGPANALIDDWMLAWTGTAFDQDGATATRGRVDAAALADMMQHAYFDQAPPKSLDRLSFTLKAVGHLGLEDGAATLTAFTAEAVYAALAFLPAPPLRWLVTGGGRHNQTLMAKLSDRLGAIVEPVERWGFDGDALEAQAFAYFAARSRHGLPLSLPSTTGVPIPTTGGCLHLPDNLVPA